VLFCCVKNKSAQIIVNTKDGTSYIIVCFRLEWLSDEEIMAKLQQIGKENEDFHSLLVWPAIEISNTLTGIIKPFLKALNTTNKTKFAGIFNIIRKGPELHWVLIYVDISDQQNHIIEYVDPFGHDPSKLLTPVLIALQTALCITKQTCYKNVINTKRYQHGSSQCGMFSLFYILRRLSGNSMTDIVVDKTLDDRATCAPPRTHASGLQCCFVKHKGACRC
jgi:hypothetical protein